MAANAAAPRRRRALPFSIGAAIAGILCWCPPGAVGLAVHLHPSDSTSLADGVTFTGARHLLHLPAEANRVNANSTARLAAAEALRVQQKLLAASARWSPHAPLQKFNATSSALGAGEFAGREPLLLKEETVYQVQLESTGWMIFGIVLVLLCVVPLLLSCVCACCIGHYLKKAIEDIDFGYSGVYLKIGSLHFNPFNLVVDIGDLTISNPFGFAADTPLLRAKQIKLDLDVFEILRSCGKRVHVESLCLKGVHLVVELLGCRDPFGMKARHSANNLAMFLGHLEEKQVLTAEWMFGDAGTGTFGFANIAYLNPIRWSGNKTISLCIVQLDQLSDEDKARPIVVKVPSGIFSEEQPFEDGWKAIAFLTEQENEWKKAKDKGKADKQSVEQAISKSRGIAFEAPFEPEGSRGIKETIEGAVEGATAVVAAYSFSTNIFVHECSIEECDATVVLLAGVDPMMTIENIFFKDLAKESGCVGLEDIARYLMRSLLKTATANVSVIKMLTR